MNAEMRILTELLGPYWVSQAYARRQSLKLAKDRTSARTTCGSVATINYRFDTN